MGKMEKLIMLALFLFTGHIAAYSQDFKAARIIGANAAAANAQEKLLNEKLESIKKMKEFEAGVVTARQALKLKDKLERENLDNFGEENRTYRRAKWALTSISNNMQYLMEGVRKSPGNMGIFYKSATELSLTAIETFNKMVKIAMKGKVKTVNLNDSGKGKESDKNDGYNLLTSAERVEMMEECIGEIKTLNRAILKMAYKLNTEVAWTYFFHEATPYHYRRINAIKEASEYAAEDIKKLKWF